MGIGHMFPIIPIRRLNEMPIRQAIIADITCDCEGKIDRFIDMHGMRYARPLHELKENQDYFPGTFLVGAYQESLGDLDNLIWDTNEIRIRVFGNGEFSFVHRLEGDSVGDVLSYAGYNAKSMTERFRAISEKAVSEKMITPQERRKIMRAYEAGLRGYTYFEK